MVQNRSPRAGGELAAESPSSARLLAVNAREAPCRRRTRCVPISGTTLSLLPPRAAAVVPLFWTPGGGRPWHLRLPSHSPGQDGTSGPRNHAPVPRGHSGPTDACVADEKNGTAAERCGRPAARLRLGSRDELPKGIHNHGHTNGQFAIAEKKIKHMLRPHVYVNKYCHRRMTDVSPSVSDATTSGIRSSARRKGLWSAIRWHGVRGADRHA